MQNLPIKHFKNDSVLTHKIKQAMMTLQGMADHRFTSVSLSTNVFLGEIIKNDEKMASKSKQN